jgi:hypothetical protein
MNIAELDGIASGLTSVRRSSKDGLTQWRYKGRLVARQLDSTYVVIRTDLASRQELLSRHPGTFHVPPRYEGHMMVVADLESGDDGAVEDALMAAWALQAGHG